jgi:hypothetical protein
MHNQSQSDRFTTHIQGTAGRLEPVFVAVWIGVSMLLVTLPGQELALDRLATRCDYTSISGSLTNVRRWASSSTSTISTCPQSSVQARLPWQDRD